VSGTESADDGGGVDGTEEGDEAFEVVEGIVEIGEGCSDMPFGETEEVAGLGGPDDGKEGRRTAVDMDGMGVEDGLAGQDTGLPGVDGQSGGVGATEAERFQ